MNLPDKFESLTHLCSVISDMVQSDRVGNLEVRDVLDVLLATTAALGATHGFQEQVVLDRLAMHFQCATREIAMYEGLSKEEVDSLSHSSLMGAHGKKDVS